LFFSKANEAFGDTAAMEAEAAESFGTAAAALESGFSDSLEWANLKTALALDEFYASHQTDQARTELNHILHEIEPKTGSDALMQSLAAIQSKCQSNSFYFFSHNMPQELSEEAALFFTLLYAVNADTIHTPSSLSHIWWLAKLDKNMQALNSLGAEERARILSLPASDQLAALEKISAGKESGDVPNDSSTAVPFGVHDPSARHGATGTMPTASTALEAGAYLHSHAPVGGFEHDQATTQSK
jgi:hypothetical protein